MLRFQDWLTKTLSSRLRRRRRKRASEETLLDLSLLEERRVFHAGPLPGGVTTLVALDGSNNLVVSDASVSAQGDKLTLKSVDSGTAWEISDPDHRIHSDVPGSTGSDTNTVRIPKSAVSGERILFNTGGGNDTVRIDASSGLPGKEIVVLGGTGSDTLTFDGGVLLNETITFSASSPTTLSASNSADGLQASWSDVETVNELNQTTSRRFVTGPTINAHLSDNGVTRDGRSIFTAGQTAVTFTAPLQELMVNTGGGRHRISGFDTPYKTNLSWLGGNDDFLLVDGSLQLWGGTMHATAGNLRWSGEIRTAGGAGGTVILDTGDSGYLYMNGSINVSDFGPGEKGGTVYVLGGRILMDRGAVIDAAGDGGGGSIFIGGSSGGADRSITHSRETIIERERTWIRADATRTGNGGSIVVWSDGVATMLGSGAITARGGPLSGNGGTIETAGRGILQIGEAPNASAANGSAGEWRADSRNVHIAAINPALLDPFGKYLPAVTETYLSPEVIVAALNAGTSVAVFANAGGTQVGEISIEQAIRANAGGTPVNLSLIAAGDVSVSIPAAFTSVRGKGSGSLVLEGRSIGSETNPLVFEDFTSLSVRATAGDVWLVKAIGDLKLADFTQLQTLGNGVTLSLQARDGNLSFESTTADLTSTADDHWRLTASGDIIGSNGDALQVASAILTAGGDIRSGSGPFDLTVTVPRGPVMLSAVGVIGEAGNPFSIAGGLLSTHSGGEQYLTSPSAVDVAVIDAGFATTFLAGGEFHLLNGTTTDLVVQNSALLTGAGNVRSLIVDAGGTIRPGEAIGSVAIIDIVSDLLLRPGSTLRLDLNVPYGVAGVDYDQLRVGGGVVLGGSILQFDGGQAVVTATKSIVLINLLDPLQVAQGKFALSAGSVDDLGEVSVGVVRSRVFYSGGESNNDVVLRDTNVIPTWGGMNAVLNPLREVVAPRIVPLPTPSASVAVGRNLDEAPPRESEVKQVRTRVLVISRLVPQADGKGFKEQPLLRLNEEWLKNLADVFRRLPDDRYRVTLVLEGGESRRVMDVIIRDGRPFEAETDPTEELPPPTENAKPSDAPPDAPPKASSENASLPLPILAFAAAKALGRRSQEPEPELAETESRHPLWRWGVRPFTK